MNTKTTIMKKTLMIIALAVATTGFAQDQKNKNKVSETVTTKTITRDNKGEEIATKSVTENQKQLISLDDSERNKTNQSIVMSPVEVDTEVNYGYEGNRFQFVSQEDKDGYRLMTIKDNAKREEYAIIKPTSQDGYYILSKSGKTSFGYFNEDGNFVVERYDEKLDKIVSDVYRLNN